MKERKMNIVDGFTTQQKIAISIRFFKEVMQDFLCKHKEQLRFESKTRGNVVQRMGGKISIDEHDKYIEEALKKIKYL